MNNMNIISDLIDSRYRIIRNIGCGAMGSVFLVYDEKLEKEWAAKLVRNMSSNELLALKSVNHPAFPRIVDSINEGSNTWLIMDYIKGKSLSEYTGEVRMGKRQLKLLAKELAEALMYLNTLTPSMLYLDCKPENIIIDSDGRLHMVDLGSVYLPTCSMPGRISGSAYYASPEQRLGKAVDVRSDIYSYGRTLKAIMPGPDTPEVLLAIIEKCTMQSPGKRFQSFQEILDCLAHPSRICKISAVTFITCNSYRFIYAILSAFSILGFYYYNLTKDNLYLLLASTLFLLLIIKSRQTENEVIGHHFVCINDTYLSQGMRFLPMIFMICVAAVLFSSAKVSAKENITPVINAAIPNNHVLTDNSDINNQYQITLYTGANEKILYYGQSYKIYDDGSIDISIPLSSLTPASIPVKAEIAIKTGS